MAQFSIPIAALAAKQKQTLALTVRKVTLDLFRDVVLKSPVDTGRFRANWNVSYGAPNYEVSEGTNKDKSLTEEETRAIQTFPIGGVVFLSNGLPYARQLEDGSSKQAPFGMVKLSVQTFNATVQKTLNT